jgi:hypothetical protein
MSTKTIKLLALLVLLVHGIGHIQGVVSGFGIKFNESTSNQSWLLKGANDKTNRILCSILYLATAVLGILAALSLKDLLVPVTLWQTLALVAAILSTFSLVLFPKALAMFFNKAGAIAVNLIIYYSILFNGNWPSAVFED